MKKNQLCLWIVGIIILAGCLSGCQNQQNPTETNSSVDVKIEDISWQIEEGIVKGEKCLVLNVTNCSQYTLTKFQIHFTEKEDITEKEKESFQTEFAEKHMTFGEVAAKQLKEESLSMYSQCFRILAAGENNRSFPVTYYSSIYSVEKIEHYALVEPDTAHVEYLKDGMIYIYDYNFKEKTYTENDEPISACSWSKTSLGNLISKPAVQVIETINDSGSYFSFTARNMNKDSFKAYVEDCIQRGFTVDSYCSDDFYAAENDKGYALTLDYYEDDAGMYASIIAP